TFHLPSFSRGGIFRPMESALPEGAEGLLQTYTEHGGINYLDAVATLPSRSAIDAACEELMSVMFPGFRGEALVDSSDLPQITRSRLKNLQARLKPEICKSLGKFPPNDAVEERADELLANFLSQLPALRKMLWTDIDAAYEGDPAAKSYEEIILAYPALEAITIQRMAHELYLKELPLIPRMMTEWAHSRTGIDIHPGATIGQRFFIDHGTGVVIGETCEIGNNVKLYQGVTLGALSFATDDDGNLVRGHKRHPTIEDGVVIYANATVLGGKTVVGVGSVIGSSVWLTSTVEPHTTVTMEKPRLRIRADVPDELKAELNYSI